METAGRIAAGRIIDNTLPPITANHPERWPITQPAARILIAISPGREHAAAHHGQPSGTLATMAAIPGTVTPPHGTPIPLDDSNDYQTIYKPSTKQKSRLLRQ